MAVGEGDVGVSSACGGCRARCRWHQSRVFLVSNVELDGRHQLSVEDVAQGVWKKTSSASGGDMEQGVVSIN